MATRKWGLRATALGLALGLTACGGGGTDEPDAGNGTGGGEGPSFVYITNTPIGINQFLELGKIGIDAAAEEYDGTAKTYESTDDQSRRSNLEAAIAEQPDVIVLITFDFEDLAKEYAEQNPEQKFLLIDACPADAPENLHCAVFREQEASYLVGLEAGMLSETGKVGSVMAVDIPFLHRYTDSFALGAQSVDPSITDSQLAIGGSNPFADPARAKEQALAMAATGVDHVFAVGAGSNGGIFEAAAEQDFYAYGVDVNQCPMAPGHGVDNTMKAVDVLVVSGIGDILDGTAEPVRSYGLAEGGMDLTSLMEGADESECIVMDHPEVLAAVEEAKQGIIDGTIEVPDPAAP
ncbi:BMP family ABC transporter substrate-binding protein [Georgenia sp. H159]|uniref:BMP family ABC transporter substrate-binding protein n=1 Tax=Georgenia sp. H159 TaxID=3076115 RepID=UPI002D78546C|nr:BMP family ABC transporter substrate-binding protein [Georgenia sp. H159]